MHPVTVAAFGDEFEKIAISGELAGRAFAGRIAKDTGHMVKGTFLRAPHTGRGAIRALDHTVNKKPIYSKWVGNARNAAKEEAFSRGASEGAVKAMGKSIPHTFNKLPQYGKVFYP